MIRWVARPVAGVGFVLGFLRGWLASVRARWTR
jgi:hypothetical protein